jgi:hypothetical protein
MLKLGICTAAQDTPLRRLWRRGLVAATMLPARASSAPEELHRFERIVSQLRLPNGTVKATRSNRLAALDERIAGVLRTLFLRSTRLLVEDWAVSTGTTALEWFRSLQHLYPDVRFAASDWILYVIEVRRERERDAFIVEPGGKAIQYVRAPFVVSLTELQHPVYFINRAVQRRALREWETIANRVHLPPEWADADQPQRILQPPFSLRHIPLLHPHVLATQSEQFRVKQHSVFSCLRQPVHAIRTMNILNRSYFSESQLLSAADAVRHSLLPGGVWIVGRTVKDDPPEHEVSVMQNGPGGWNLILRIGNGSEIEPIVGCNERELLHA